MTKTALRVSAGPIVAGGDALVRRPGEKVMFVEGALPGETVEVEIVQERSQLVNARVVDVIEASPHRVTPTCALFDAGCGGCRWDFISTPTQHELKLGIVHDALTRIAKLDDVKLSFHGAVSATEYRTTMRMAVANRHAGMRRIHSNEVLAPVPCTITHRLLHPLITDGTYDQPEVTLRASVSTGDTTVYGDPSDGKPIIENVNGQDFMVSPGSFFQSGPEASALLSSVIDSLVPINLEWIVDAYAGIGVLGAVLAAKRNARITAIESNTTAADDARYNLRAFNAEVFEDEVATLERSDATTPDVIVADPSRTGLGNSASTALAQLGSPLFVLVSCDPASMARDINLLRQHGYNLDQVQVLDLFPQTPHVETVAVMSR